MHLIAIPAFQDNYIWMLHTQGKAWVVDPGEADPVLRALSDHQLELAGILITHHHGDHVGGVNRLTAEYPHTKVFGPAKESLNFTYSGVTEGEDLEIFGTRVSVIDVPGHTAGHVAYFLNPDQIAPILFCGDTLFSGGCGRLFEGTPSQMHESLRKLASYPSATRVCCAHEYTLANLRFAITVEPDNLDLQAYVQSCRSLRDAELPTLPSTIGTELQINPFLRCVEPTVIASAETRANARLDGPAEVLGVLREWKNSF
jgi:hydroxyacylglutathione hydrolase